MEGGLLRERYTGKGAYTFKNGNVYEGEFKDGNICGSGIILILMAAGLRATSKVF